jgi:hypothetical protein
MSIALLLVMYFEKHVSVDARRGGIATIIEPDSSRHGQKLSISNSLASRLPAKVIYGRVIASTLDCIMVGFDIVDGHPRISAG